MARSNINVEVKVEEVKVSGIQGKQLMLISRDKNDHHKYVSYIVLPLGTIMNDIVPSEILRTLEDNGDVELVEKILYDEVFLFEDRIIYSDKETLESLSFDKQ